MIDALKDFTFRFKVNGKEHVRVFQGTGDTAARAKLMLEVQREFGSTDTLEIITVSVAK